MAKEIGLHSFRLLNQAGRTGLILRHSTTRIAVVPAASLPPHHLPADVAEDPAHALERRIVPRAQIAEHAHGVFRATWCDAACATGLTTISSMSTCGGRVTAKRMQSATSAADSGFRPAYTALAACLSPWNRTTLKSVSTSPGAISVTRIGSPLSSRRSVREMARTACFTAV